ncbi:MAG: hypothetical protein GY866_02295 [Proteobacteria bacterium]|nr:hypothetical protein [Pseudomonadota bacterium]
MELRINHNLAAHNAHRNMVGTRNRLDRNFEKLTSGQEINSAVDGAARLSLSERLRGQIHSLNQAISNSESGITMIQVAEANLNEISQLLVDVRQLCLHTANSGTNDQTISEVNQKEIVKALETITSISERAQFANKKLLDGSLAPKFYSDNNQLEVVSATHKTQRPGINGYEVKLTSLPSKPQVDLTDFDYTIDLMGWRILAQAEKLTGVLSPDDPRADDSNESSYEEAIKSLSDAQKASISEWITIVGKTGADAVSVKIGIDDFDFNELIENIDFTKSYAKIREKISNELASTPFSLVFDKNRAVDPKQSDLNETDFSYYCIESETGPFSVRSSMSDDKSFKTTKTYESAQNDIQGTINGEPAFGRGDVLTGSPDSPNVAALSVKYSGRLDPSVEGEGEKWTPKGGEPVGKVFGVSNPIRYQIGSETCQIAQFSIQSTKAEHLAREVDNGSGFANLDEIDVRTEQGPHDALRLVDQAIDEIALMRGDLGSFQKDVLESNLSNLRIGNENLFQAESKVRDSDVAEKMASHVRHQLSNQTVSAMLKKANDMQGQILNLLN